MKSCLATLHRACFATLHRAFPDSCGRWTSWAVACLIAVSGCTASPTENGTTPGSGPNGPSGGPPGSQGSGVVAPGSNGGVQPGPASSGPVGPGAGGNGPGPSVIDPDGAGAAPPIPVGNGGTPNGGGPNPAVGPNPVGPNPGGSGPGPATPSNPAVWINESGSVADGSNSFGIVGYWYAFGDGVTSTQSGSPYRDGMYCIDGEAPGDGDGAHWGAGMGLDLNAVDGEKLPYEYEGTLSGFRMRFQGSIPADARIHFVNDLENEITPFISLTTDMLDQSMVFSIADARVPLDWEVDNAGERVENGILYSLQILVPGADAAGPIDLCLAEFEPVFEGDQGPGTEGGPYINSDAFALADDNEFGIQGPVYAISDGVSTTQSGNPYQDGKYCVSGEFSGAADDWGAGIAFDLNKPPGGEREPFSHQGNVAGFRIGLSGNTPGLARIQFVLNEPQEGNQPFLVGQLNSTVNYRIAWAQVPTSWDVSDAGLEVGDSIYTLQLYLDGSTPGPFEVCVEEFTPLSEAELDVEAQAALPGYNGARTVDESVLAGEYASWKEHRFVDCGDGTACVPRDEGDCISEGIGYGMLITAGFDDQAAFDQLWAYFERHKNANGVMNWQTNECGAATSQGSATDGELDAAMALIQAGCRWGGSYRDEAIELINAIRSSEVTFCDNQTILKPGDTFGGCDRTNPSYFAPGYYKVFESLTGDTTWTDLANDNYSLLATLQANMNGLVPNWTNSSGTIPAGDDGEYGPDAPRTPWRIATDYVWYQDERAVTFLDNVTNYIDSNGGIPRLFTPSSTYRGALAMSAVHQGAVKAQEYTDAWLTTVVDDTTYFPGTLRPIYLLLLANQFPNGCE